MTGQNASRRPSSSRPKFPGAPHLGRLGGVCEGSLVEARKRRSPFQRGSPGNRDELGYGLGYGCERGSPIAYPVAVPAPARMVDSVPRPCWSPWGEYRG